MAKGKFLDIGGRSSVGFGAGSIEVRIADNDDGTRWHWRSLTDEERTAILQFLSTRHS